MITTISEFEDAMKDALQSEDVLLPANTDIVFAAGSVEFVATTIKVVDGKIVIQIKLK